MNSFNSNVLLGNGIVLLVIAITSSLTNGTLLVTIYRNPLRCFRTKGGVLVTMLAVTDLMTGTITALNVGVFSILNSQGIPSITIRGILQEKLISQFTVRSGIIGITAFSFDRLLGVMAPFFYRNHVTPKLIKRVMFVLFPLVFLSSLTELFADPVLFNEVTLYGLFLTPFITITFNYATTYILLKKKMLRMNRHIQPDNIQRNDELLRLTREKKLFVTALLVLFGFVVSFCPWVVVLGVTSYCPACTKESWYFALYRSSIPFLYLNSAFNPLIYAWRIKKYRKSILKAMFRQHETTEEQEQETH